jgi:hypothetical protein
MTDKEIRNDRDLLHLRTQLADCHRKIAALEEGIDDQYLQKLEGQLEAALRENQRLRTRLGSSHQEQSSFTLAWWKIPLKDFICGAVSGFAGKMIEYPFDTVKVRMQTNPAAYKSSFDCLRQSISSEGFSGLYKGLPLPLAGTMIETSCLFTSMGQIKSIMTAGDDKRILTIPETLVAGGGAGFFVSFILTPIELIKCRMQMGTEYTSTFDCMKRSIQGEGPGVLFKGLTATWLREVPGTAGWFGAYETFVRMLTPPGTTRQELHPLSIVFAGGLGGMAYWVAFYPADTVKSRIQTAAEYVGKDPSFWSVFRSIYAAEGLAGLYAGLGPTLIRAMPANGGVFLIYEMLNIMLSDTMGIQIGL